MDPLGFTGGDKNLYRYVSNHPTNAVDQTGLWENVYWTRVDKAGLFLDVTLTGPVLGPHLGLFGTVGGLMFVVKDEGKAPGASPVVLDTIKDIHGGIIGVEAGVRVDGSVIGPCTNATSVLNLVGGASRRLDSLGDITLYARDFPIGKYEFKLEERVAALRGPGKRPLAGRPFPNFELGTVKSFITGSDGLYVALMPKDGRDFESDKKEVTKIVTVEGRWQQIEVASWHGEIDAPKGTGGYGFADGEILFRSYVNI
jgi:hypothetical protein